MRLEGSAHTLTRHMHFQAWELWWGPLKSPACRRPLPYSQVVWDMFISPWAYSACPCGWASSDHTNHQDREAGGHTGYEGGVQQAVGRVRPFDYKLDVSD